jgi:glycosyltransferase involved in cell wall biosynthesis
MQVPSVSCILPTRNRRPFVGQAIRYFLRQDYENKELLILDDGKDEIADLVPNDDRVRYVRLEQAMPLGKKRNHGCALSSRELIAHWDDDLIAPHRLRLQVDQLLASGSDLCGARELLHLAPPGFLSEADHTFFKLPLSLAGGQSGRPDASCASVENGELHAELCGHVAVRRV